jgi:hypothetical protein
MKKMKKIKKGDIAFCSRGMLGLITEDEPKEVTYLAGEKDIAYVGIQLQNNIGGRWSSRNPRVVGHIDDLIKKL